MNASITIRLGEPMKAYLTKRSFELGISRGELIRMLISLDMAKDGVFKEI
jgi:hypothetical protein